MIYKMLILLLPFFCCKAIGQTSSQSSVKEIENLYQFINENFSPQKDTIRLRAIVDSISQLGNIEKTEFATYYSIYLKSFLKPGLDKVVAYYKSKAYTVAAFKSATVKSTYKFYLGDLLFNQKDYSNGMDLMLESINECKQIGYDNVPLIGSMLYVLSLHYYNFDNFKNSISYAHLAAHYQPPQMSMGTYNTIGMAYQKLQLYDSAVISLKKAIELGNIYNVYVWVSIASGNLGRTYCLQKNYAAGMPMLRRDLVENQKVEPVNSAISALYIADAWNDNHQPDSAMHYIHLARQLFSDRWNWDAEQLGKGIFGNYYYLQLSRYNEETGNYFASLKNKDTAIFYKEKYRSQFDWRLLTSSEKRIEGLEYQKNIAVLATEKRNKQLQNLLLIIAIIALAIITFLIISRQRIKLNQERQLAAQKEANLILQQQQAQQELETAKEQLTEFVNNVQEKNLVIDKIKEELTAITNKNIKAEEKEGLIEAIGQLKNASLLTNDDWYKFQERFDKVYKGFFTNISIEVPGINPAEERVLALSKLKISSRQMGMMLGISPASVRTAKYRLRKKLQENNQPELESLLDVDNDVTVTD